jgi:hydrogenase maturation protease
MGKLKNKRTIKKEKKIIVLGVGNLLLRDEGVGIHAIKELEKECFPAQVKIVDGGTGGIDLLFWLEEADYAIIIDCVKAEATPGTIFYFPVTELDLSTSGQITSLHEVNLNEFLLLAKKLGKLPPTVIYGIQPAEISWGLELSPAVKLSLPRLVHLIGQEIKRQQN